MRRVNSVPLVIGFGLVATFVAIVFLVVLPGNDSGKKETKTKIVSAAGEAANINASAPIGFVPARSTPTPSAPVPTPEPVAYRFPSAPQPTQTIASQRLKEALSFRTRSMNIEHPVAYQAPPAGLHLRRWQRQRLKITERSCSGLARCSRGVERQRKGRRRPGSGTL